jgi:small subunit ribosomal protein S18
MPPARRSATTTTAIAGAGKLSFCADKTAANYKEVNRLRRYLSERARSSRATKTGTCAARTSAALGRLKRARHVALLPYARRSTSAPSSSGRSLPGAPRASGDNAVITGLVLLGGGIAAGAFGSLRGSVAASSSCRC